MFLNLNTGTIGVKATLTEAIGLARKHNFDGVDFSISEVVELAENQDMDAVRTLFDDSGVRPGSWGFPVNFRQDAATWQAGLEALPAQAKAAQELGCLRTSTFLMPCSDEMGFGENFEFHRSRLQPAAQILADHGCRLGLEWVGPKTLRDSKKYPFIHTLEGALELCNAIGTNNMGLLVDSYHVYTSHSNAKAIRQLSRDQVVTVHVNDAIAGVGVDELLDGVRDLPGATGVLDLDSFLLALKEIGYDGPVTAEPFSQRVRELPADEAVAETSTAMHRMWQAAGF